MLSIIPNALSTSRAILAVVAALYIYQPTLALWLFVAAALTDAIDGPLARHLGSSNPLGDYFDQGADWVLAGSGLAALLLRGWLPWWALILIIPTAAIFAGIRLFLPPDSPLQSRAALPGAVLFVTGLTLAIVDLAAHSYGWRSWYIPAIALALLTLAILKRSRLSSWLNPWRRIT